MQKEGKKERRKHIVNCMKETHYLLAKLLLPTQITHFLFIGDIYSSVTLAFCISVDPSIK